MNRSSAGNGIPAGNARDPVTLELILRQRRHIVEPSSILSRLSA